MFKDVSESVDLALQFGYCGHPVGEQVLSVVSGGALRVVEGQNATLVHIPQVVPPPTNPELRDKAGVLCTMYAVCAYSAYVLCMRCMCIQYACTMYVCCGGNALCVSCRLIHQNRSISLLKCKHHCL